VKLSRKIAVATGALVVAAATLLSAGAANAAFTSPTEVSYTQIRTTGYVGVVDGFTANEVVTATANGGAPGLPLIADANGVVTLPVYNDATAVVGDSVVFAVTGPSGTQSLTVFVIWDTVDPALGSAPTSITVSAFRSTGFTATSGGFAPGEVVDVGVGRGQSGGSIGSATADGTGTVSFTYVEPTAEAGETFDFSFVGATARASFVFAVVADPAAAPAPAPAPRLAETGADLTGGFVAAGALLLAGAAFGAVALRRRSAKA
jgi:hypothetical protein